MEMGGWLYKCGHFHPSDFLQVALCQGECSDCIFAKEIIEQAKQLRRRKETAAPKWSVKAPEHTEADRKPIKNRRVDCKMGY